MLQPLRRPAQTRVSRSYSAPAPVGGWNRREARAEMPAEDAVFLDNWFPRASDVVTRRGYSQHCATGENDNVETLVELHTGTTQKLLAAVNGKLIDATTSTPSTVGTGFSSDRWSATVFNGRIFLCNGTDAPRDWTGSTLTTTAWTGPSSNNDLNHVLAYKSRLYFIQKNSQKFWYGGVGSVTGALTEFNIADIGNFGGNLIALQAITQDGGDGVDDLFCAFLSSGEVLIYQGSYPGDANWALVGVFRIGKLIDGRAVCKVGSDVLAVTYDGYMPLTRVLAFGRAGGKQNAVSDKISLAAQEVVRLFGGNSGWQAMIYPKGQMLIVNVPYSSTLAYQHVMNLETGAWCRFTNMNAYCWATFADNLYFGAAGGIIYKADDGNSDAGAVIQADGQTAFNYMGARTNVKRWTAARPIFAANGKPSLQLGLAVDFDDTTPASQAYASGAAADTAAWDSAVWDVAVWGEGDNQLYKEWQSVGGIGRCASLRVKTSNNDKRVYWNGVDYIFEPGSFL